MRDSKVMLETPVQSIFGLSQRNIWLPFRVCDWRFGMYWEVALGHSLLHEGGKGTHGTTQDKHGLLVEYACNNQKVGAKGALNMSTCQTPNGPKTISGILCGCTRSKMQASLGVHNVEYSDSIWILCLYGCQWREGIMIAY